MTEVDNSNIHYAEKLKHFRYEFMNFIEKEETNTEPGFKYIVQCKRYKESNRVGANDIRSHLGAIDLHDATFAYFIHAKYGYYNFIMHGAKFWLLG